MTNINANDSTLVIAFAMNRGQVPVEVMMNLGNKTFPPKKSVEMCFCSFVSASFGGIYHDYKWVKYMLCLFLDEIYHTNN